MPFLRIPPMTKIREAQGMGRARWRTDGPLEYETRAGPRIVVPAGFVTDFSSVPRVPLAYWLTGDTAHMSAVLHDYLCREFHARGLMGWRDAADMFREAMQAEGVPGWRRWLMYWAVRAFGEPTPPPEIP